MEGGRECPMGAGELDRRVSLVLDKRSRGFGGMDNAPLFIVFVRRAKKSSMSTEIGGTLIEGHGWRRWRSWLVVQLTNRFVFWRSLDIRFRSFNHFGFFCLPKDPSSLVPCLHFHCANDDSQRIAVPWCTNQPVHLVHAGTCNQS